MGSAGFPATFEHHDLTPGGTISYSMSDPDLGESFDGTWNVIEADPPTRLVVEDAILEDDGTPSDGNSMTRMEIDIEAVGETTRDSDHAFRLARRHGASDRHGRGRRHEGVHVPDRRPARRGRRLAEAPSRDSDLHLLESIGRDRSGWKQDRRASRHSLPLPRSIDMR